MNHLKGAVYYLLGMAAVLFFIWAMASCDTAKRQAYHYNKFIKFGGKIDTVERTVTVTQIVKGKDGKDSLIYVDVPVKCPEATVTYKDRWHIRRMDRQERDSLKRLYAHNEKMLKLRHKFVEDSLNKVIDLEEAKEKTVNAEKKSRGWGNPYIWLLIAIMALSSIYLIKRQ